MLVRLPAGVGCQHATAAALLLQVEEQPSALFKYLWSVRKTSGECFLCQFLARHRANPKPRYTTCLFNETWMASAGQELKPQLGCQ
jgi:hypothetical protein